MKIDDHASCIMPVKHRKNPKPIGADKDEHDGDRSELQFISDRDLSKWLRVQLEIDDQPTAKIYAYKIKGPGLILYPLPQTSHRNIAKQA